MTAPFKENLSAPLHPLPSLSISLTSFLQQFWSVSKVLRNNYFLKNNKFLSFHCLTWFWKDQDRIVVCWGTLWITHTGSTLWHMDFHLNTSWRQRKCAYKPHWSKGDNIIITSLAKEVMFLVALVCLFVCLSVCGQHYSNTYERIGMKFYGGVLGSTMKNWLNFGGDLGILRWVNEQKSTIMVVTYPDRGAGNDPFFKKCIYLFYLFIYLFILGGGGGRVVFHLRNL